MDIVSKITNLRERAERSVISLPALMIKSETLADNIIHGDHAKRKAGSGEKFWQFREYDTSDRPQDIDWRQSAKTDQVYIKQKEWQITRKVFLWCASGQSMDYQSDNSKYTKQENAQIICLALALLLSRAKEQIGIYGQAQTGRSEETLEKIARLLHNKATQDDILPDTDAVRLPKHAYFIGVGDFLSPIEDIKRQFDMISGQTQNAVIIQVLDPAEQNLSYTGRVKFKGLNGIQETIDHVPSVKDAYRERMDRHIEDVKTLCASYDWNYVLHSSEDLDSTLKTLWVLLDNGDIRS